MKTANEILAKYVPFDKKEDLWVGEVLRAMHEYASQLKDNRDKIIEKIKEQNKELKKYVNLLKDSLDLLADNYLIKENKGESHITELLSDMANIGAELNKNIKNLESELSSLQLGEEKLPTLSELIGLDKFNLTESQRNDCISLVNHYGIEEAIKQAEKFSQLQSVTTHDLKEIDKAKEEKNDACKICGEIMKRVFVCGNIKCDKYLEPIK
jgi:uncharacterized phage infection (PIP) family protein YhgE